MAEIGNVNEELVLNCSGSLKIRRGNDIIEFFDSLGNPNIKLKNVVKDGQPNYNSVDGIYFDGINTYIKSGNTIKTISLSLGGNASLPEGTILLYKGVTNPTGWYFYPLSTGIDGLIYISNKQYTGKSSIELYERGSITKSATVGDTYNLPFSEIAARYATTLADYGDISGELYFEVTGANGYNNYASLSDDDTKLTFSRFGYTKVIAKVDANSSHTAASYEYILQINKKTYNLLFLNPPQISITSNTWVHLLDYIDKPTLGNNDLLNSILFYLNGQQVTEYMLFTTVGYNSIQAILPSTNLYEEARSGYLTVMVSDSGTTDYNGSVQSFDIFGNNQTPGTIRYMKTLTNTKPSNKSEFTTSVPSALDAGTYYIWYTINDGNIDGPVVRTISPKIVSNPTIILSLSNYTYDGNAKTPTVIVKDGNHVILASEYTVGYSNNTNIGTATVTVTDVTGGNYVVNGSTTFTISSAPKASITAAPTAKTLTYNETAQALVNAGTASNGTVYYKVTTSNTKPSDTSGFSSSIPTGTDAGTYYVWYYAKGDTGYDDGDISSNAVPVTIAQEEETIETSASITDDYITEYQSGGNSIDNDNVKIEIVNNSSDTLISGVVFNNLNSEDTWIYNDNGDVTLSLTNNINSGTNAEYNGGTLNNLDGKTPVPSSYPGFLDGNVHITRDLLDGQGYNMRFSGFADNVVSTYSKGKCYTLTVTDNGITVSVGDNIQSGSYVTSDSKIKVKIKNNTESNLTLTGAIKFKNGNTDIVSTTFNNSSVTINSGSSSTEYEIDFGNNAVTNTPSLTSIELTTSSNETISIALTSATFNMGALYTINYGTSSSPVIESDDDIATHDWNYDNYILDSAIDSFIVNNYNMGNGTYGNALGWENLNDKAKRELIVNASATTEFDPPYIYETHYANYDGYKSVTKVDDQGNDVIYNSYVFNEITKTEYDNHENEDHYYKLGGPLTCLNATNGSNTREYFEIVRYVADNAARDPGFNLNRGRRVRPLGGVDKDYRMGDSETEAIGNKWNSLFNGSLCTIINAENANSVEVNADGPTSYPSGHSAQSWMLAILATQAKYIENDSNWGLSSCLDFISKLYRIGVYRTVERFHWNSDTMYGRLWATMMAPVINAISDLDNLYNSIRGNVSGSIPTYDSNDADFEALEAKFETIVTITPAIENYLYSMYSAAKTVLNTQNHVFLSSDTYPEVYPLEGYTVKVNGVSKVIKYRGDNVKYRKGTTELDNVSREQIMQSWLMAMCLAELYCDKDTNKYTFDSDVMNPDSPKYNPNYTYIFTNPDSNTQTLLFALAYELGGGREVNLYDEYKLEYDPTILRLAASLVYATERSKYSASTIRGLNNGLCLTFNTSTTAEDINNAIECTARNYRRSSADPRYTDYFTVGYGISTYYIFNDAPGPYNINAGDLLDELPAPFKNKWKVGTSALISQHQDPSLFNLIKVNLTIINNSGQSIPISGEINLYFDTLDGSSGHESISCVIDESINWGDLSSYLSTPLGIGETKNCPNCILIPGKGGSAPWPHFYLNKNLHPEVVVYVSDNTYGHVSEYVTATTSGGVLTNGGNYTITISGYNPQ